MLLSLMILPHESLLFLGAPGSAALLVLIVWIFISLAMELIMAYGRQKSQAHTKGLYLTALLKVLMESVFAGILLMIISTRIPAFRDPSHWTFFSLLVVLSITGMCITFARFTIEEYSREARRDI